MKYSKKCLGEAGSVLLVIINNHNRKYFTAFFLLFQKREFKSCREIYFEDESSFQQIGSLIIIFNLEPQTKYKIITKWNLIKNYYSFELKKMYSWDEDFSFVTLPKSKQKYENNINK